MQTESFLWAEKSCRVGGTRHVPEKWRESVKKRSGAGASGRSARKGEPES